MANFYSSWHSVPNGGARYRLRLTVNVVAQNVALNRSTVEYALVIEKDRSHQGFYDYWADWAIAINGSTVASATNVQNPTEPWLGWNSHTIHSGRVNVTHNANGIKENMAVSGSWSRAADGWAPGTMSVSGQMDLPAIQRATQPVVSPSPAVHGTTVTITLDRADSDYTHDLTWESGSLSGTIGTGIGTSTTWTVPDVMSEFPGKLQAPITIIAVTKDGSTTVGEKQTTLLVKGPPPPPSIEVHDPNKQLDIRARMVEWVGGEWVRKAIIPASTIQLVDPNSATATCTISVSALHAAIPEHSIVDIEVFNGTDWVFTDHRFVLSRNEGDDEDLSKMRTYSGTEFLDYVLGFAYMQKDYKWEGTKAISATKDNPTPTRVQTSPGEIMRLLTSDAKARGWGPRVDFDFTLAKTSLGDAWAMKTVNLTVTKGTPLIQVLQGMVEDGHVEYRASYHDNKAWLVLLNPGTGQDFGAVGSDPVVNFNLLPLKSAPRRSSAEKRLTRVSVVGVGGVLLATREQTPFDEDVFGHMEGWVEASGVGKKATAQNLGDRVLRDNSAIVVERTFEFDAANTTPQFYPYWVYRPGDWVLVPDATGETPINDRISQVTMDKQADSFSMTIVTGHLIMSGTGLLAKRQQHASGGSIPGGTLMTPQPLDSRIPEGPVILTATSEGYWTSDGLPKSAVTITWTPVVLALNEADIEVDLYEVWTRPSGTNEEWRFLSSTDQLELVSGNFDVLTDHDFRVRARSTAGVWGEFSEDEQVTMLAPPVDLDGPDLADLYTDGVGTIYAVWGGLLGTDPAPARVAYVGAEVSTDDLVYVPMGTPITAAGTIVINPDAWGDFYVRLRAYDRLGNAGDASASQVISLTDPHIDPEKPQPPTDLAAVAGAGWDASGFFPMAWFDVSWTPPTTDTEGNPIDIVGYDLWGKRTDEEDVRFLTSSTVPSVRWTVADGEEWSFQVRAASAYGGLSDLTDPFIATADAVVSAAPAPDAPSLDQYAGILRIGWSGGGMLPQIKYAYATISTTETGTYTRAGMPLNGAGEVVVPGLAPGEYWAKIVMVDERGLTSTSPAAGPIELLPITGITIQTSPIANTGIKMTDAALTAYDGSGNPTFILDATTGEVWIAPYDAVFEFGADGTEAETGNPTTGLAIGGESVPFNTFFHPAGVQIRNDQTPLSWWEGDASDASLINFVSPRARVEQRFRVGDYEMLREAKSSGSRLVIRYQEG